MPVPPPEKLNPNPILEARSAYAIAHSARCKLSMSAKDPEKNLRFMIGHAFLLDKVLYRVAQIEEDSDEDIEMESTAKEALTEDPEGITAEDVEGQTGSLAHGHVKFDDTDDESEHGGGAGVAKRGPLEPKKQRPDDDDDDGTRTPPDDDLDDYDDDDEDGGGGGGLGLTRFGSASQKPPRMIPDEGEEDEDEEPISPPALPADLDVSTVVAGPESEEVGQLYESIRGCPCHGLGDKAEKGRKFWEIKGGEGDLGKPAKRMALMQVEA